MGRLSDKDLQSKVASNKSGRVSTDDPKANVRELLEFLQPPLQDMSWENVIEQKRRKHRGASLQAELRSLLIKHKREIEEVFLKDARPCVRDDSEDGSDDVKLGTDADLPEVATIAPPGLPMYVPWAPSSQTLSRPVHRTGTGKDSFHDVRSNYEAFDNRYIDTWHGKYEKGGDRHVDIPHANISHKPTSSEPNQTITTFLISGIPTGCSAKQFRDIVLEGFKDAIDFLYTPCDMKTGTHMRLAVINLVDASHAELLRWAVECSFAECEMIPAQVQGYRACTMFWGPVGDLANTSKRTSLTYLATDSPQVKQQLHKTKMCTFFMKNRCSFGADCAYAHALSELQQHPDLKKTRLCQKFFSQKCFQQNCKFAHSHEELRSTQNVYKTVLCRWSTTGSCKMGSACRYAHTLEELRLPPSEETTTYKL